ncbi:hypothetical protein [Flavobacterium beibuense]|uniref:hypothetical protein n=1 Tax=Flavobacterium beibuense TaxID=657326 RepID=UPI003A9149D2
MTKDKLSRLGTFSNNGLGTSINTIPSEDLIKEAQDIVDKDLKKIKSDFKKQLYRLENFIKDEIRVIPRTDDFVNWFFNKKKITQNGKSLPKIKDEEIIRYAKEYLIQLKTITQPESLSKEFELKSFQWQSNPEKLNHLYLNLISNKYIGNTDFKTFELIFSGANLSVLKSKITWLKIAKNKYPNKRSISDFINLLTEHSLIIQIDHKIPNVLSACFDSPINNNLIFTYSNLSNYKSISEDYLDLEKIIKEL